MPSVFETNTHQLRQMMQQVGISSFKKLGEAANVSDRQIKRLRQGRGTEMQILPLLHLSQILQVSLPELLVTFTEPNQKLRSLPQIPTSALTLSESQAEPESSQQKLLELQQEYDRLQAQLQQQREELLQEFQQSSLQILEPWLIQWSAAAYAAQQNPQAPAVRLLPLVRPIEQLLHQWGIEQTSAVGSEVSYDPRLHQLMDGIAEPGGLVRVRYAGYTQNGNLLYRAKVSPVIKP
jgi:molecular chaperone GrpE (heat shock protein)